MRVWQVRMFMCLSRMLLVPFVSLQLYTGQAFSVPLRRLPARWLIKATQAVVKSLAPATQVGVGGTSSLHINT